MLLKLIFILGLTQVLSKFVPRMRHRLLSSSIHLMYADSTTVADTAQSLSQLKLKSKKVTTIGKDSIMDHLQQAERQGNLTLNLVLRSILKVASLEDGNKWCLMMEIYGRFAKGALSLVDNHSVKSMFYEKLLTSMMKSGGQVHLFLLISDALGHGIIPTESTLTYLLLELSAKGEISIMIAIIDQVSRFEGIVRRGEIKTSMNVSCIVLLSV